MPLIANKILVILSLFLIYSQSFVHSFPHNHNNSTDVVFVGDAVKEGDLVLIEQIVTCCIEIIKNSTFDQLSSDSAESNESSEANERVDDLIFLSKKPQKIQINIRNNSTYSVGDDVDLLTSAEEQTLTAASTSSSSGEEYDGSGVPREIELRRIDDKAYTSAEPKSTAKSDTADAAANSTTPPQRIDMGDFVALIPAAAVKSIATNYYRNDPEVQRAYAYLNSDNFKALKQRIIQLPEMSAFLRYLNSSGLDLVNFLYTLTNLTNNHVMLNIQIDSQNIGDNVIVDNQETSTTKGSGQLNIGAVMPAAGTASSTTLVILETAATSKEEKQLHGLHGLVDSILNILPQDEILATFFDKLETNEQFSKLVDSISTPAFAKILNDLQYSVPLRNLIFTLHNNGIYITSIVDSLKAYFFLGTF